jgi:hypothetical protein
MTDVVLLIARARQHDPEAARALADLVQRLARYRPMPGETSPDRILMQDHRQGAWRAAAGSASAVVVNDHLVLRVGRNKASLLPSQAFTLAE